MTPQQQQQRADDAGHLPWGAEALWQRLEPLLPGFSVEVVARTVSTNTQLLERARAHAGRADATVSRPGDLPGATPGAAPFGRRSADLMPCLLVAEHQTGGRGRLGRGWVSAPGTSLLFSLSLPLQPADWSGLSLAVGLALAEALDGPLLAGAAPRIQLKWPNDLWLVDGSGSGRKLGGVLIETVNVGPSRIGVIGVGLNVLRPSGGEFTGLASGYACLRELDPLLDAPTALARVAEPLVRALLRFPDDGFAPLAAGYAARDLLRGHRIGTTLDGVAEGVAEGVDESGALLVAQRRGAAPRGQRRGQRPPATMRPMSPSRQAATRGTIEGR